LIFQSGQLRAQVEVIQNRSVVAGPVGNNPESAKMNVNSKSQGMLIPRMLFSDMELIEDPADALMVFVTDEDIEIRGFYYYDKKFEEWVMIPAIDCLSCESQFTTDLNGNGIPDLQVSFLCETDCAGGSGESISISTNLNDLCADLNYNSYEVFVDGTSVTDVLSIDASGDLCYESETINNSVVTIVLYTECCCNTLELIAFPDCVACEPQYTLDVTPTVLNCLGNNDMNMNFEVTLNCDLCDDSDCNEVDFIDWFVGFNNFFYGKLDNVTLSCGETYTGITLTRQCGEVSPGVYNTTSSPVGNNLLCGDPANDAITVNYGSITLSEEDIDLCCGDCYCFVTNVSGANEVCEGDSILITANTSCPDGWTQLHWNWGTGSTTTNFPDNNIFFGSGVPAGNYTVAVTTINDNECNNVPDYHFVEVKGDCDDDCICDVVNIIGPNSMCEDEPIQLTASMNCTEGWSSLSWNWGSGSTTTTSPDNNINFGANLNPGSYTITVTATNENDCINYSDTHTVFIEGNCGGGECDCTATAVADDDNCEIDITVTGPDCSNFSLSVLKYGSQNGSCSNGNCSYLSNLPATSQTIVGGNCAGNSSDVSDYKIILVPDGGSGCGQPEICVTLDCFPPACDNEIDVLAAQIDFGFDLPGYDSFERLIGLTLVGCDGVPDVLLWGNDANPNNICLQDVPYVDVNNCEAELGLNYCDLEYLRDVVAQPILSNTCSGATIDFSNGGLTWTLTLPANTCGYQGLKLSGDDTETDADCTGEESVYPTYTETTSCNCN